MGETNYELVMLALALKRRLDIARAQGAQVLTLHGKDGTNVTPAEAEALIRGVFSEILPALKGDPGKPGAPGKPGTPGRNVTLNDLKDFILNTFEHLKPQLRGADGTSVAMHEVEQVVMSVFENLKPSLKGQDGIGVKDITFKNGLMVILLTDGREFTHRVPARSRAIIAAGGGGQSLTQVYVNDAPGVVRYTESVDYPGLFLQSVEVAA